MEGENPFFTLNLIIMKATCKFKKYKNLKSLAFSELNAVLNSSSFQLRFEMT